ncbi:MAG: hypothetical protein E6J34_00550 [Chloroflexi bacterium]|nr:MAG: hypothetical protein E6J34_00550 [Chloroflexota bacterium]
MSIVYVVNRNGNPLMPCKLSKARKLLRDGRARVKHRSPFTIPLLWDCEEHVQPVTLGIDKGSHVTGFSCAGRGEILLSGEIHHRLDVTEKMDGRRTHRRSRRNRKWYRPKRFNNRATSRRSGLLPPSIKTNVQEVIRIVKLLALPISAIVVEDVQVDIARLNNPTLKGEPPSALPKDCQLLGRGKTILWEKVAYCDGYSYGYGQGKPTPSPKKGVPVSSPCLQTQGPPQAI